MAENDVQNVRIVPEIPVIFTDGLSSQSYGFGVVKMYMSRFDPDPGVIGPNKETTVCQLIMPVESFVRTVMFLEHRLEQMVKAGVVSQALADDARQAWKDNPKTGVSPNG